MSDDPSNWPDPKPVPLVVSRQTYDWLMAKYYPKKRVRLPAADNPGRNRHERRRWEAEQRKSR